MRSFLVACLLAAPLAASAQIADPEVKKIAEKYLNALTGQGDDTNRDLLLGGATMNAKLFNLENWRIVSEKPVEKEDGDLSQATQLMNDLDRAGRSALQKMLNLAGGVGDDVQTTEISQEDAARLLAPTRDRSKKFIKTYPVLAHVARVGKEVYWHPKNPVRPMLTQAGNSGKYSLEFHYVYVETKEGPRQVPRTWPLRILRFKTAKMDTGWKVLPASDWNGD